MANSIRGRAKLVGDGQAEVRLLITHPMSVERVDTATGQRVAAHFIEELTVLHKGETVLTGLWGQGISQNPYLGFALSGVGKGDVITVQWRDNKGETDSAQIPIN